MENINFDKKDEHFILTDFPNSEKVVKLNGIKAQELADIALHRSDLLSAAEYLQMSLDETEFTDKQGAFWKMAIISYLKCFGKNNARVIRLDIKKILIGDTFGQEVHGYFKDLRDKNIAHDDNAITQCLVGAVVNKAAADYKIEKVIAMNLHGQVYCEENVNNLKNLIQKSIEYVDKKYELLCQEITDELENFSHERLINMEGLSYRAPELKQFSKNRDKLTS